MTRFNILAASIFLLLSCVVTAQAAEIETLNQEPVRIESEYGIDTASRPGGTAKAIDEVILDFFDFQDESMLPDPQGWTAVDRTDVWHTSTFNCANLDDITDNHAWWCGDELLDCGDDDEAGGYGKFYYSPLSWSGEVADPLEATSVRVIAVLNHDLELGYDYLYLEYLSVSGWVELLSFDGLQTNVMVDEVFSVPVEDYVDGWIHLRWRVTSDQGYDAQDCIYPNDGAAQIDNITVFFTQGGDPVQMGAVESCEPGDPLAWVPGRVGNYGQVWATLPDADPNISNETPRWGFIDDGVVEPESSGYPGTPGNDYGPGGFVVNPEGGLVGPGAYIWNEIWSPPIAWPEGEYTGGKLGFEVYADMSFPGAMIFYQWAIRSTADPDANDGLTGWSTWKDNNTYYYGGPSTVNFEYDFSAMLVEDCTFVQAALRVRQFPYWGTIDPSAATPAPYFDDVTVTAYNAGPYYLIAGSQDLARDAFPSSGLLDEEDLSANSARFDAVQYIDYNTPEPLDYVQVTITPLAGSGPVTSPVIHYLIGGDPDYDSVRSYPMENTVLGTLLYSDTYAFDLPDEGLFFPGDVVHYYFEAIEGEESSTLPQDLEGFDSFSLESVWPELYTMRVLPSHRGSQGFPPILLWDDSSMYRYESWADNTWQNPLNYLGFVPGVDYDIFVARGWNEGVGTGLGGTATLPQITGYETILYSGGGRQYYPLCDGTNCFGNDIGLLDDWLLLGSKEMVLSCNNLAYTGVSTFLETWPSISETGVTLSGSDGLTVNAEFPYLVFDEGETWSLNTYQIYDAVNTTLNSEALAMFAGLSYPAATLSENNDATVIYFPYDLMFAQPTDGGKDMATTANILGDVLLYLNEGVVPTFLQTFDAIVNNGAVELNWRVLQPTDITQFRVTATTDGQTWSLSPEQNADHGFKARDESSLLLGGGEFTYTLAYANDREHWSVIDKVTINMKRVPLRTELTGMHPNPFNPSTRICFSVDRSQEVLVSIYDVRGRHMVDLAREVFAPGSHELVWRGEDAQGRRLSSGTYFVRLTTDTQVDVRKIMMLK